MEISWETCVCDGYELKAQEAEDALLNYLRDCPGQLLREWQVLNRICACGRNRQVKVERRFFLAQLLRLARERKVIRYRRGLHRGKIRISEAFV